jgi:DNA primase
LSFIYSFLDWANHNLLDNEEAYNYLLGRGVSEDQCKRHKLGFIPECFEIDPAKDSNHDPKVCRDKSQDYLWCDSCRFIRWSSLYIEEGETKTYKIGQRIVGHIVIPLTDYTGNCVGFQVRSLSNKAYDTFAIRRRPFGYFFGTAPNVHSIWAKKSVILTEGAFDGLLIERLIAPNVLALTTSTIGRSQAVFMHRFVDTVYWCADLDDAGRKGLKSLIYFHGDLINVRDVKYPKIKKKVGGMCKDPGEIWKEVGDERFKSIFGKLIQM